MMMLDIDIDVIHSIHVQIYRYTSSDLPAKHRTLLTCTIDTGGQGGRGHLLVRSPLDESQVLLHGDMAIRIRMTDCI